MTWKPGQSGNPDGRKPGSINKRSNEELWHRLEARGDRDPADILSEIANGKDEPKALVIAAAIGLMPYRYSKRGLTSEPPPLVYNTTPIDLPHPAVAEIADTIANIEYLAALHRDGKLDQAAFEAQVAAQRLARDGLIEQAKLLVAQGGPKDQRIVIEGGLPPLPGCDIDMGKEPIAALKAAAAYPHVVAAYPHVVNGEKAREGTILPPVPVIPHPESPLAQKPGPPEPPDFAKPKSKPGDDPA
jgi:hypothetical protein